MWKFLASMKRLNVPTPRKSRNWPEQIPRLSWKAGNFVLTDDPRPVFSPILKHASGVLVITALWKLMLHLTKFAENQIPRKNLFIT